MAHDEASGATAARITAAHDAAVAAREDTYVDPATGYTVFTTAALAAKGRCCGNVCRHCPYGAAARAAARGE
jgi:hypothetical protein